MNLDQFLTDLANQGIQIRAKGDQLEVQSQNGPLPLEIQELLEDFEEEILFWLTNKAADGATLPQVIPAPADRYKPFPLTDIQHAYWVGRSGAFALGDVGTHIYLELACSDLDVTRLNRAWQRLIAHHDMLRAVVTSDGQQQVLVDVPPYQIAVTDLRGQPPATIKKHIATWRDELANQVLPAEEWPLFDIRVTQLDNQTRLHISLDVLFCDFGSLLQLFTEWQNLYVDLDWPLPQPSLSFRDYVLAEQQLETTAAYAQAPEYWLGQLDTLPPAPELPLAQDATSLEQTHFRRRSARLTQEKWGQLKTYAGKQGLTPNGVLLAAFAEVLTCWSKSPRLTLNLTLFNRQPLHPEVDQLIGDFTAINLLAVDNSSRAPFVERAQALQQQLWADLEQRAFDGMRVIRELARQQGETGQALMPVVFTSGLGLEAGCGFEPFGKEIYSCSQTPQVWLDHLVIEKAGQLNFSWNTVDDLFPAGLMDEMFGAYCELLECLADASAARQASGASELWQAIHPVQLPVTQQEQRRAINATDAPISDELLHTLFLQQVTAHADEPAVITPQRTLTYRELYIHANTIAHWLRQRGALPNQLVAVAMEKGWEQVAAVLGIQIAGAAYLPIAPNLPTERQTYLLEQGEVTLLLTQSELDATLVWPEGIQCLHVDNVKANDRLAPLETIQQVTDLAYVIYTSGSTGLPKGVVIDHRGAVNTVLDINRRFAVTSQDRVLALSALNFDLSVYDIFGLLAVGGTIVMPSPDLRVDPAHWLELMVRHRITLWNTVPALMQMLVDYFGPTSDHAFVPSSLRLVMMSGDWIPVTLPDRIKSLWDDIQVYSLGGATEASIWSIDYPIEQVDPEWPSIPYGKPLTNQSFHVLDHDLKPRPTWVPGDLYIGGIGLALGYWKDEAKSNERFIIHPESGERLYKTGDLGRYLPDGNIEFLGREDFQVKIRGHRIELGEIESTLLQHPGIKEAVVNAVGDPKGSRQLVAYVVYDAAMQNGAAQMPDIYTLDESQDVTSVNLLTDPVARLEFKLDQPGIRSFNDNPASNTQAPIQLSQVEFEATRREVWLSRQSYRTFVDEMIPFDAFSHFLSCLIQMPIADAPLPKYRYPSAGNLYPVQTYLYIKPARIEGLAGGFYYHHPQHHRLYPLSRDNEAVRALYASANRPIFEQAAFSLFLIADMDAIAPMYGKMARDFSLLEAGYMSQLLMMQATEQQLGLCPIGGLQEARLKEALGLSERSQFRHCLVGGRIDPIQMTQWLQSTQPTQRAKTERWQEELRTFLQAKLPPYMMPTHLLELEALPLSANGKVDRQALPIPDVSMVQTSEFVPPRNDTEQFIASIWSELLGLEQVGIHDNFFALGGDSLIATQLRTRLRDKTQIDLPLGTFFEYTTIIDLADQISGLRIVHKMQSDKVSTAKLPVETNREQEVW